MLIHELAERTGVAPHTIRFYEREGLLDPRFIRRGDNRYRHYTDDVVERIQLIRFGQTAGFTLSEIKELMRDEDAGKLTPQEQKRVLQRKVNEIDRKMDELQQVKTLLLTKLEIIEHAYLAAQGAGD